MTRANCADIDPTPKVDLKVIPFAGATMSNGRQICVTRSTDTFVSTAGNMDDKGACKGTATACGGTDSSEGEHIFCTTATDCPITSMKMENSNTNTSFTEVGSFGGSSRLYTTTTGGNAPIAEVLASNDKVCKNHNDESYYGTKHLLMKSSTKTQFTCEGGADDTFVEIVSSNLTCSSRAAS